MTGFGDDQKDWNGKNEAHCCRYERSRAKGL